MQLARKLMAVCLSAGVFAALPASTSGYSLNMQVADAEISTGSPINVSIGGSTDTRSTVAVKVALAEVGCAALQQNNLFSGLPAYVGMFEENLLGSFDRDTFVGPFSRGSYLLCGWIQSSRYSSTTLYRPTPVTFRVPTTSDGGAVSPTPGDPGTSDPGNGDPGLPPGEDPGDYLPGEDPGDPTPPIDDKDLLVEACNSAAADLKAANKELSSARKAMKRKRGKARAKAKRRYASAKRAQAKAMTRWENMCPSQ